MGNDNDADEDKGLGCYAGHGATMPTIGSLGYDAGRREATMPTDADDYDVMRRAFDKGDTYHWLEIRTCGMCPWPCVCLAALLSTIRTDKPLWLDAHLRLDDKCYVSYSIGVPILPWRVY